MSPRTSTPTVAQRLERVFQDTLLNDAIRLGDGMIAAEIPGLDERAHLALLFAVEREFGVRFGRSGLAVFDTIGALRRYLEGAGRR
jgi:acyl carrier protein